MKKYLTAFSTTVLLSATPFAWAASSPDLTVTGTITPDACTASLANSGTIDFGKIQAKDLNTTGFTELGRPRIQLTVACDGPTTFAIHAINNRPNAIDTPFFGLGLTSAGEKLGHFVPYLYDIMADGQPAASIISVNGGDTWVARQYVAGGQHFAAGSPDNPGLPIAAKDLTMDLEIRTWIGRADRLTLTDETAIDGSATFELKYL